MGCFVVAEFLLTSVSRGPSALAEPLVHLVTNISRCVTDFSDDYDISGILFPRYCNIYLHIDFHNHLPDSYGLHMHKCTLAYSYLDCEFVILYLFVAEMFIVYFGHKKWKFVICNSGVHNNICCGECTDHFMFVGVWCAKSTVSRRRFICLTYLTPFCLWPNLVGLCNVHMDRCNMVTSGKQE